MMGIINRITKRTLQGEMGRTLLTIFFHGDCGNAGDCDAGGVYQQSE
ncbi:hypothetical protein [Amylolactobacillus amylophilus]|nr:hypothetical protein [Amylolactobacillus amylophilus]